MEPVEQLLQLASQQLQEERQTVVTGNAKQLYELAKHTHYVSTDFPKETALQLFYRNLTRYPLGL